MNDKETTMRVLRIIDGTTVDGPGFRTSIYFAGCSHRCPGCHNPQSWDFSAGEEMSLAEIAALVEANDMDVTFSGGDPIYSWPALTRLAQMLKEQGRGLWCYTGFLFEELCRRNELHPLLSLLDVVVDGPFIESLRSTELLFRGSANQRLIRSAESLRKGEIILWKSDF